MFRSSILLSTVILICFNTILFGQSKGINREKYRINTRETTNTDGQCWRATESWPALLWRSVSVSSPAPANSSRRQIRFLKREASDSYRIDYSGIAAGAKTPATCSFHWSGRGDLNARPPAPKGD